MKEHGNYSFEWQQGILILSLQGAFNEQAITQFFNEVTQSVLASKRTHWVLLSRVDETMLGSLEVLDIIKGAYVWGMEQGCIAAAISGANFIVKDIFTSYFDTLAINTRICVDQQEAISWLAGELKKAEL